MAIPNWLKLNLKPDFYLDNYLSRWFIIPRNRWFNIYLHKFVGSDDDRAVHDHPWWSVSFNLAGRLEEVIQYHEEGQKYVDKGWRKIKWLKPYYRTANHAHMMILNSDSAWTLFITGPRKREWGFWTRPPRAGKLRPVSRWVHYATFLKLPCSYSSR